ncbi:NLR family CARD domain-containing protein 3-like isoform 1-T2 [Salvelinus alpinus]
MACKTSLSGEREEASTSKMSVLTDHPTPIEAKRLKQQREEIRSVSPVPSCVSMKSNRSMTQPMKFCDEAFTDQRLKQQREEIRSVSPVPSCVSMKSDRSMTQPMKFCDEAFTDQRLQQERSESPVLSCGSMAEIDDRLKSKLKRTFQCVFEGTAQQGNPTLLNEIYTELYITEGGSGEVNNEHEVRQIDTLSRRLATQETPIKCNDIFKLLPGQDKHVRTVLTKGVAGIGKTVSVQKFILDWAEGKANQDIQLIFPLPFRELNLMEGKKHSLVELLHCFFKDTKESEILINDDFKVLFIFDGLDECRLPLDFQNNNSLRDVTETTSVDVLLTNLIEGNLLPNALLWITSRPAAANRISPDCVDQVTEVRGFNDPQKEEYFRKRIHSPNLASRIITHMKSSRSLYIMCHIPVFCWIAATVLERLLGGAESGEIPKTLTQMNLHFLIFQTRLRNKKYPGRSGTDPEWNTDKEMILKLGKLAFEQLEKGNLIFYEEDLRECGIDVKEASVYSGVCTQVFREECGLNKGKVYCFVHLSIQEFLAALYVFLSFVNNNRNLMLKQQSKSTPTIDLYKSAVDQAIQSANGHLDLFLRFLLGLSLKSNQTLLRGLLVQTGSSSRTNEETVEYIKEKIRENPSLERCINLFHCLNELNDHSLVEEIQSYLSSGSLSEDLSPAQLSALVVVVLTSEEELDVFELRKYSRSDEGLLRMLPVVKASRTAVLTYCYLTERCCKALASTLSSTSSGLRQLDLSKNDLKDSGVALLSIGLGSPQCKLESLRLSGCRVTGKSCASLASALKSNPSHLRELDLSGSNPGDSGVSLLSAALEDPLCKLETLRLSRCSVTEEGCASLASALRSNPANLRELDLSCNYPGDSGVKLISALLEEPHKLKTLRLNTCKLTENCCQALASALSSNSSSLRELDLSKNKLQDSGMTLLCAGLGNPHCKLGMLKLSECGFTDKGCASLASALRSNPSHLKELNMSWNYPGESGVKLISALLEDPYCKLKTLRLSPWARDW